MPAAKETATSPNPTHTTAVPMNTTRNAGEVGAALLMACMARAPSSPESRRRPGITKAEKGLIWLLIHDPGKALVALDELEPDDLEGLALGSVLDLAKKLKENSKFSPTLLLDHTMAEAPYITGIASESEAHVHDATECVRELKRRRYTREVAAVQQEIDRQQQRGAPEVPGELDALLRKKHELIQKMQALA